MAPLSSTLGLGFVLTIAATAMTGTFAVPIETTNNNDLSAREPVPAIQPVFGRSFSTGDPEILKRAGKGAHTPTKGETSSKKPTAAKGGAGGQKGTHGKKPTGNTKGKPKPGQGKGKGKGHGQAQGQHKPTANQPKSKPQSSSGGGNWFQNALGEGEHLVGEGLGFMQNHQGQIDEGVQAAGDVAQVAGDVAPLLAARETMEILKRAGKGASKGKTSSKQPTAAKSGAGGEKATHGKKPTGSTKGKAKPAQGKGHGQAQGHGKPAANQHKTKPQPSSGGGNWFQNALGEGEHLVGEGMGFMQNHQSQISEGAQVAGDVAQVAGDVAPLLAAREIQ